MHCSDVVGQWKAERQWRDSSSRKEQGVVEFAKMMEHQIQVNPTSNTAPCAMQNMRRTTSDGVAEFVASPGQLCDVARAADSIAQH
jgi:hypothetical protein